MARRQNDEKRVVEIFNEKRAQIDPLKTSRDDKAVKESWLDDELRAAASDSSYAAKILGAFLLGRAIDHGHLLPVSRAVLNVMPYQRYLQTPHWKEVSGKCKDSAQGRCQVCNSGGELHAHHRTYERRGFEYPSDLVALCAGCHQLFHDSKKIAEACVWTG